MNSTPTSPPSEYESCCSQSFEAGPPLGQTSDAESICADSSEATSTRSESFRVALSCSKSFDAGLAGIQNAEDALSCIHSTVPEPCIQNPESNPLCIHSTKARPLCIQGHDSGPPNVQGLQQGTSCRQVSNVPVASFQREKLLAYLEEKAKKEEDWEDAVPFVPGTKQGNVFWPKDERSSMQPGEMEMPIEVDVDGCEDAPPILIDLAKISMRQGVDVLNMSNNSEVIKGYVPKVLPDEPNNDTDVDACIRRLEMNDANLREININNLNDLPKESIKNLIKAACSSKHIEKLLMANTALCDQEAQGLLELLRTSPSLRVLNIESNYISSDLLSKVVRATLITKNLQELRAENQNTALGNQVEMDIAEAVEENDSLVRVGISLRSREALRRLSNAVERNLEKRRLRRLQNKTAAK